MSLLITIIFFFAIVGVIGNFKTYLATHESKIEKYNSFSTEIHNKIAEVYNEIDWEDLTDTYIETKFGNIEVLYEYTGLTEFSTNNLQITFSLKDKEEVYNLERSVYYKYE